jgi:hypothetical protein
MLKFMMDGNNQVIGECLVLDNVPKPSLFDFEIFSFEVGKLAPG